MRVTAPGFQLQEWLKKNLVAAFLTGAGIF